MPNHGSLVLSDLAAHYLTLVREPCGLRGHLNVARLIDKRGDAKLTTDHAPTHVNCDKARVVSPLHGYSLPRCPSAYLPIGVGKELPPTKASAECGWD
jgi:hypothetical protein